MQLGTRPIHPARQATLTLKLHTIICSTRPGRVGPAIAQRFHAFAKEHNALESELIDLAEFKLPVYDEQVHPAKQQ
jgi:NAD(P)H-dependent FMN reductase